MARKKNRDAKFIIYQCLYIFVIAFLAMKDATILSAGEENMDKLKPNETKILKSELDSLKKEIELKKDLNKLVDAEKDTVISLKDLDKLKKDAKKEVKNQNVGDENKIEPYSEESKPSNEEQEQ